MLARGIYIHSDMAENTRASVAHLAAMSHLCPPDQTSLKMELLRGRVNEMTDAEIVACDRLHPHTPYWEMLRFVFGRFRWTLSGVGAAAAAAVAAGMCCPLPVPVRIEAVRGHFRHPCIDAGVEASMPLSRREMLSMAYHCCEFAIGSGLGLHSFDTETGPGIIMLFVWAA